MINKKREVIIMEFKKEDLNKFEVIDKNWYVSNKKGNTITISDGLITHNIDMTKDDIVHCLVSVVDFDNSIVCDNNKDWLAIKFDYYKNDIVREYLYENEKEFNKLKNIVENFYNNVEDIKKIRKIVKANIKKEFKMDDLFYFDVINNKQDNTITISDGLVTHTINATKDDVMRSLAPGIDFDNLAIFSRNDIVRKYLINHKREINKLKNTVENFYNDDKMLCNLKKIQDGLTIKADDYRNDLLNGLNNALLNINLKPIPVQKYSDETDVLNTIRKLNLDNPKNLHTLDQFMCEHGIRNNHFLSDRGVIWVKLVRDNGNYYTMPCIGDNTDNTGCINVNIQDILNTDDILYQPSLEKCINILKSFPNTTKHI